MWKSLVENLVEKPVENGIIWVTLNFYGGKKGMATFYKQNDEGEYIEADKDVDELFRQKSSDIVSSKLSKAKEKLREEIEDELRQSATETIKSEARAEIESEYKEKLEASESKAKQLDVLLRRKTIAAEYGFKPEAEEFLGNGSDDDMRAKADTLKNSFSVNNLTSMEKQSEPKVSKLQESTGIRVEI